ncbi:putative metal-dependent hydrolase [Variovorax sp. GrIS 2.14]|uniref:M48 family metallopeptidase n=1 Tax=Variovorax sp. GrIS 2.14 TaxID=3071709 RepID=UPI0038F631A4
MRGLLQFTLDLFNVPEADVDMVVDDLPPAQAPKLQQSTPVLPLSQSQSPSNSVPHAPATPPVPLRDVLSQARFIHPRATREVVVGHARVGYEFTRGKRGTIGFVVGAEGLSVRAPRWVTLRDVDAAVLEKADWIVRKLAETQERHARVEASRIEWKDGATFPFLGEPVVVQLDPRHGFKGVGAVLDAELDANGARTLRLAVANNANPDQIRDAAQAWLTRQARRLFTERLDAYAPKLGVRWKKLSLSNAATRWGSASSDGSIRLNWRLIHFRLPVIDYVVAHELSHLRVMDHSQRFWETVESVMPDYQQLRRHLKDETIPRL